MVGTGPSVHRGLDVVGEFDGRTITTNYGIDLVEPDYYVGIDMTATMELAERTKELQIAGTRLITLHRDVWAAQVARKVDHYNEFIIVGSQDDPSQLRYGRFRYSGPFCLEYACHNGASEVHMVGFDGYRWLNDYHYTNVENPDKTKGVQRTHDVLRPACQEIARAWGHVRFVQYGEPVFTVDSNNWEVVKC